MRPHTLTTDVVVVSHDIGVPWREALGTPSPHLDDAHYGHLLSRTGIEFEVETAEDSALRQSSQPLN